MVRFDEALVCRLHGVDVGIGHFGAACSRTAVREIGTAAGNDIAVAGTGNHAGHADIFFLSERR